MKRFFALAGATIVLLCTLSAASAQRDSVERGTRMDTDALRDDVRTNRLQIPQHPIAAEQPPQPAPDSGAKTKPKKARSKKSGTSSQ